MEPVLDELFGVDEHACGLKPFEESPVAFGSRIDEAIEAHDFDVGLGESLKPKYPRPSCIGRRFEISHHSIILSVRSATM